jgi:hypothetical protein
MHGHVSGSTTSRRLLGSGAAYPDSARAKHARHGAAAVIPADWICARSGKLDTNARASGVLCTSSSEGMSSSWSCCADTMRHTREVAGWCAPGCRWPLYLVPSSHAAGLSTKCCQSLLGSAGDTLCNWCWPELHYARHGRSRRSLVPTRQPRPLHQRCVLLVLCGHGGWAGSDPAGGTGGSDLQCVQGGQSTS